jgi:hypothetical protein
MSATTFMKGKFCFLLLFSFALTAYSQNTIGTKKSLIPLNWKLFQEAVGDLNKDSIDDVALIIENSVPNGEGEKERALLILLKNNRTDDTYTQICRADHVILGSESGGLLGDPFWLMEIKKNVLRIDFVGGSADQWTTTHRYRFQGGAFYVIGATYKAESHGITEIYDYNLSSGKIIVTKKDATNKANNSTKNLVHKIKLPPLAYFSPEAVWAILMPSDYAKVSTCVLQDYGLGDCAHVLFDCGDFGNAETYLDEASEALWQDLGVEPEPGDMRVNPKYKGKKFEITYAQTTGIRCEQEGEAPYQLIVGFKMKN